MKEIRYWFGWLLIIPPVHGVEQFLFGIDGLYFPGAVTAIPFVIIGAFLLRAVIREFRNSSISTQPSSMQYARCSIRTPVRR